MQENQIGNPYQVAAPSNFGEFLDMISRHRKAYLAAGAPVGSALIYAHQEVCNLLGKTVYHQYNGQLQVEGKELVNTLS
jgi:hypothetical protein